MNQKTIAISAVQVGKRARKDLGDLESLANSMKEHGLLHPIVITPQRRLVAGLRRIAAARVLGWAEIPVTEVDVEDMLSAERDENEIRKAFTPSEAVQIGKLIEEREKPKAKERQRASRFKPGHDEQNHGGARSATACKQGAEGGKGAARLVVNIAGKAVGLSRRKYKKAKAVVSAAEENPEKYGDLPEMMDESSVESAFEEMERRQGKRNNRHPVHRKTHYLKAEKAISKALNLLEGLLLGLESVTITELDKDKANNLGLQLLQLTRRFSKLGRQLKHG